MPAGFQLQTSILKSCPTVCPENPVVGDTWMMYATKVTHRPGAKEIWIYLWILEPGKVSSHVTLQDIAVDHVESSLYFDFERLFPLGIGFGHDSWVIVIWALELESGHFLGRYSDNEP